MPGRWMAVLALTQSTSVLAGNFVQRAEDYCINEEHHSNETCADIDIHTYLGHALSNYLEHIVRLETHGEDTLK